MKNKQIKISRLREIVKEELARAHAPVVKLGLDKLKSMIGEALTKSQSMDRQDQKAKHDTHAKRLQHIGDREQLRKRGQEVDRVLVEPEWSVWSSRGDELFTGSHEEANEYAQLNGMPSTSVVLADEPLTSSRHFKNKFPDSELTGELDEMKPYVAQNKGGHKNMRDVDKWSQSRKNGEAKRSSGHHHVAKKPGKASARQQGKHDALKTDESLGEIEQKRDLGTCSYYKCSAKATHLARHGVYRGLPLCAKHHEGQR